jgi:ATP-binding cassette subfamily A (ABC1) protein 3
MTIREHLELYARAKGIPAIEADVNLVMEKIGLQPYESRLASKLSGGNKRKLSLAIAILGQSTFTAVKKRCWLTKVRKSISPSSR